MKFTTEQSGAIKARGRVLVSAAAGSGKTATMIERAASLIAEGTVDVSNILAVTFTNKAAAQMREKLRAELLSRLAGAEGEKRVRLKEQLSKLPLADISTIHSFCARLLRTYFFYAGVDPGFRILAEGDPEGRTLRARALDEAFEEAYERGDESFMGLLSVYFRKKKDERLREIVRKLYDAVSGVADYRGLLLRVGEDAFGDVCDALKKHHQDHVRALGDAASDMAPFFAASNARAAKVCAEISAAADTVCACGDLFEIAALPMPKISNMPPSTNAEGEMLVMLRRLSALSKEIKEEYRLFAEYAPRETEYARYLDAAARARALARLALRFDEAYERLKQEAGVLDYNDLEHRAARVLSHEEALGAVREKYRFLFVDEYQDVNPAQERILSLIAGEETFLVGDAKQAIYGFRGSRSRFFSEKEREYPAVHRLTENFRSSPAVIGAVNRVFAPLFPADPPMRGGSNYTDGGQVCLHVLPARSAREREELRVYSVRGAAREREEDAVSDAIVRLVCKECGVRAAGEEWYDTEEKARKRVTFGDVAVLVRKNTGNAERVVRALAECGIPVTSTSKVNVCEFFEARLLLDVLSCLDNPEQDIPYAAALLSAIGGMNEGELAKIRLRFPSPYTFRAACAQYRTKMADAIAGKLNAFHERAKTLRTLAEVRTAAEMMTLLLSEGLEAQIAALPDGQNRLLRVRRLVSEAERRGGSVRRFLSRLKASGGRIEAVESGGENAVKVLTMHASKGLEYPVVILADLDVAFHGADRDEVMWTEHYLAAPKSYDIEGRRAFDTVLRRASELAEEEEEAEQERNLLYVAMTRARYRLHLILSSALRTGLPVQPMRLSDFLDGAKMAEYLVEEEEGELAPLPRRQHEYRPNEEEVRLIDGVYCAPYAFEESTRLPAKTSATELMREQATESAYSAGGEAGATREEGTAYHAFLQYVAFGADAEEELKRLRAEGALTEEQAALLDAAHLRAVLSMPGIAALAGRRVLREQTFLIGVPARELGMAGEEEILCQGAIDLLCEDDEGYLILDYKYSSHDDARLKSDYALQIALYKKAVARAMRVDERTVRARILNIKLCREIEM